MVELGGFYGEDVDDVEILAERFTRQIVHGLVPT
jgi:hypothetical protein